MQVSGSRHPGRLLIEEAIRLNPQKVQMAAKKCSDELKRFTDLSGDFYSDSAEFDTKTKNLKRKPSEAKRNEYDPSSRCKLEGFKLKCLKHQVIDFVRLMGLEDPVSIESLTAYLFNKVARPKEKLDKVIATQKSKIWQSLFFINYTPDAAWSRFDTFLIKINAGTWKNKERQAQIAFEKYQEKCSEYQISAANWKHEFSILCTDILDN